MDRAEKLELLQLKAAELGLNDSDVEFKLCTSDKNKVVIITKKYSPEMTKLRLYDCLEIQ